MVTTLDTTATSWIAAYTNGRALQVDPRLTSG